MREGRSERVSIIEDERVTRKILEHLGLPSRGPAGVGTDAAGGPVGPENLDQRPAEPDEE